MLDLSPTQLRRGLARFEFGRYVNPPAWPRLPGIPVRPDVGLRQWSGGPRPGVWGALAWSGVVPLTMARTHGASADGVCARGPGVVQLLSRRRFSAVAEPGSAL